MRKADGSRRLVQENHLTADDLVWTIFLCEGTGVREPIAAIAPFSRGPASIKTVDGSYIANPDNLNNRFVSTLKNMMPISVL